jgi:hypothetical protein
VLVPVGCVVYVGACGGGVTVSGGRDEVELRVPR